MCVCHYVYIYENQDHQDKIPKTGRGDPHPTDQAVCVEDVNAHDIVNVFHSEQLILETMCM